VDLQPRTPHPALTSGLSFPSVAWEGLLPSRRCNFPASWNPGQPEAGGPHPPPRLHRPTASGGRRAGEQPTRMASSQDGTQTRHNPGGSCSEGGRTRDCHLGPSACPCATGHGHRQSAFLYVYCNGYMADNAHNFSETKQSPHAAVSPMSSRLRRPGQGPGQSRSPWPAVWMRVGSEHPEGPVSRCPGGPGSAGQRRHCDVDRTAPAHPPAPPPSPQWPCEGVRPHGCGSHRSVQDAHGASRLQKWAASTHIFL
jgi:hypothetical protein